MESVFPVTVIAKQSPCLHLHSQAFSLLFSLFARPTEGRSERAAEWEFGFQPRLTHRILPQNPAKKSCAKFQEFARLSGSSQYQTWSPYANPASCAMRHTQLYEGTHPFSVLPQKILVDKPLLLFFCFCCHSGRTALLALHPAAL